MKKQTTSFQKGMAGGLLALMLLTGSPALTHAQTPSLADLQAKIAELQAAIAALTGATSSSNLSAYTWSSPLRIGSTGEAVRELQRFLNSSPDTRVAVSGAGSPGMETTYYGPATAAAVSKFQVKYRSDILIPSGLTNPTGYFGPATMAKANTLRNAPAPTIPTNQNPTPSNPSTPDLSGEGEVRTIILDTADNVDVEEGSGDAGIATITFEAAFGDVELNRLDLQLTADAGNSEKDPWDTFESISLMIDGDEVATKRIDRKTDYQNRTTGIIRLSNLGIILPEDEEVEIEIVVSVVNNVDGAGTAATWNVAPLSVRYFDADGVATNESSTGDLGDSVSFDIVERGDGEELKFSTGRNNPASATIVVDDSKRTNNVTILEYEIEAIDGDIELETLGVNLMTGTAEYNAVVDAVRLIVDGKTFRSQSITTTGAYSTTSVLATFDIDGKVTIDEDDTVLVKVVVDLKSQTGYQNGETIKASVTSEERTLTEAEGADDVSKFSGTAVGNTHRLIASGLSADNDDVKFTISTQGQNDTTGIFRFELDITAVEGDFYIKQIASTTADTTTGGFGFTVEGNPDLTSVSASIASTAREDQDGTFVVREGQSETFTITVVIDPSVAGQYRVGLNNIVFASNSDGISDSESYLLTPSQNFRTTYQFINN